MYEKINKIIQLIDYLLIIKKRNKYNLIIKKDNFTSKSFTLNGFWV